MYLNYKASHLHEIGSIVTQQTSQEAKSLVDVNSITFIPVDEPLSRPQQVLVCYNTDNYSIVDGKVIEGKNGEEVPKPAILLRTDDNKTFVFGCDFKMKGTISTTFDNGGLDHLDDYDRAYWISGACFNEKRQQLFFSDLNYGCIYINSFSGKNISTFIGVVYPRKLFMEQDILYIADENKVVLFNTENMKKLQTICINGMSKTTAVTILKEKMWIVKNDDSKLFVVSNDEKYDRLPDVNIQLAGPSDISSVGNQYLLIVDKNRLLQTDMDGNILVEFGKEEKTNSTSGFDSPRSVCVVKCDNGVQFVLVTDYMNRRLAKFLIK